ncbi:MAG: DNA internalization-related competence protein ComEC/Rec2 [Actinomycetota bacterium]|nr:DNA internalization-related competence protein ComEC/Rec2 [Actinomycetota bacterium]
MKWSPLAVAAIGLVAGITLESIVHLPTAWLLVIFITALIGAALVESFYGEPYRAPIVILLFIIAGAFLLGAGQSRSLSGTRAKTHTSPIYKTIATQAARALPADRARLLLAIVFGDQAGIAPLVKNDFLRAGLLHLFAASGFNVTLAAGFLMLLARAARLPKLLAASLALASVGFYFYLVGPTPSVLRATVMSALLYSALFFGRRLDATASTATAVLVLLAIDPASLFDIGWQLSFAGLLGILALAPRISEYIKPEAGRLAAPLVVTAGAQIAVAPFLVYYFGQVSTVALIANPIVTTAVAYVTGVGFLGCISGLAWPAAGRLILASLDWPLRFINGSAGFFASLPASTLQIEPSGANTVALLALLAIAAVIAIKHRQQFGLPALIIVLLSLQAVGLWMDLAAGVQRPALTANFLDVGEGDATLVKSRNGAVILVDGGRDYAVLDRELRRRGVRHIDLLILSHAHADHVGSLDELMDKYPVALVVEPGYRQATQSYRDFKLAITRHHVPLNLGRAGREYRVGDVRIDILWPTSSLMAGTESDINNNSVVAKLSYKNFSLLLPGDIQEEAISELLKRRVDLKAQVLKVSHQGSSNGTTADLLRRIRPRYAVISVGPNSYGHPHRPTLDKLRQFVPRVLRTDRNGDVTVSSDGQGISLATEKSLLPKERHQ